MTQLLDVATVNTHGSDGGGWTLGEQVADKTTSVNLALRAVCAEPAEEVLVESQGPGLYNTRPIYLDGTLEMNLACFEDGDKAWLAGVVKDALELGIGRALVTEPLDGYGAEAVWIGLDEVHAIPFTGDPYTSGPALALAVGRARVYWAKHVTGVDPVLHISPTLAPVLFGAGLVHMDGDKAITIWGDRVAMSPGYDSDDPDDDTPVIFWSGPITIEVGSVESTEMGGNTRQNQGILSASVVALIDVSPRSIVRIDVTA